MNWNDTRDQLLTNVGKLHELSPDTVAGITSDTSDNDEDCALAGIAAASLRSLR